MEKQIKKYGWITTVVLMIVADIVMFAITNKTQRISESQPKGAGGYAIFVSILGILMVGIKVFKEWNSIKEDKIKLTALFFGILGTVMLLAAGSYVIDFVEKPTLAKAIDFKSTVNWLTAIALIGNIGSLGVYIYQNK